MTGHDSNTMSNDKTVQENSMSHVDAADQCKRPTATHERCSNRKVLSDSDTCDWQALLDDSMPDPDADSLQKELFIKRQYTGEQCVGKANALFRYRMGVVLLQLKETRQHGDWERYVHSIFPFTPRTANNYMRIAQAASEDEAATHGTHDLMIKLDMARHDGNDEEDAISRAVKQLKSLHMSVLALSKVDGHLLRSLRRMTAAHSAFTTVTDLVDEVLRSVTSLKADIAKHKQIATEWDAKHRTKESAHAD